MAHKDKTTGIIFNMQKYSLHDGPGIRTIVFLKGCPLRCRWCANPESQLCRPQLGWNHGDCIGCQSCVKQLKDWDCRFEGDQGLFWDEKAEFDAKRLRLVCPTEALHVIGEEKTVSEILERVERDAVFYGNSGGGLTVSGGEPLMQPEFVCSLLREAGRRHMHRAMETSGYAAWDIVKAAAEHLDYLLYDVKLYNDELHRRYTGVSNVKILENLQRIRRTFPELPIRVRTPVIPGVNDNAGEIRAIRDFVRQIPGAKYELLKYHRLGQAKYESLHREYSMGNAELSEEKFQMLQQLAKL